MVKPTPVIIGICFLFLSACAPEIITVREPIAIPESVTSCSGVPSIPNEVTSVDQSNKLTLDIYRAAKDCKNTVNNINAYITNYNKTVATPQ